MLSSHHLRERLRIVGLSEQPTWAMLADENYGLRHGWTNEGLETELRALVASNLASGALRHVDALLLECTFTSQFHRTIRRLTDLPIVDLGQLAISLLHRDPTLNTAPPIDAERTANVT
jgi:hypothetical protein